MKYIVSDWEGNSVVRGHFRKAKAEWRRANKVSFCAWIKPHRIPDRDGQVYMDPGERSAWVVPFRVASKLGRKQIKEDA